MVCSMSRKGNCWDNAPTERFFSSLKRDQQPQARMVDGECLPDKGRRSSGCESVHRVLQLTPPAYDAGRFNAQRI